MSFISKYVRENHGYSIEEIREKFLFDSEHFDSSDEADKCLKSFIEKLLKQRIIKEKKHDSDDEEDQEAEIECDNYRDNDIIKAKKKYAFSFVGIIICKNRIIYSYPKYLGDSKEPLPLDDPPIEEMRQVIRVIEKYSKDGKKSKVINDINLFVDEDDAEKINTLSVMLFLLEDYASNGVYENDERIIEINGSGEILWQKTVDETYPMIVDNRPYYFELFTKKTVNKEFDYFKMLHEYVLTCCSREIHETGLDNFFSLPSANLSEEEESFFGDTGYILNQLDSQIMVTYDDRKLSVLKAMRLYFCSNKILIGDIEIQLIGTRSFNMIWEEVCAKVFKNQKGDKNRHPTVDEIKPKIDYTVIGKEFDKKPPTLVELIKHPIWQKYENESGVPAAKTFNPDFLRFEPNDANGSSDSEETYVFYILDAKYYCPEWEDNSIIKQPGVEDVAKQYLYYLAYKDILEKYNVTEVKNYFIMPKRKSDPEKPGFVQLDILRNLVKGKLWQGVIEVRMLDPTVLYDMYLNDKSIYDKSTDDRQIRLSDILDGYDLTYKKPDHFPHTDDDFAALSQDIADALQKNEPELVLDSLHAYSTKYIREICVKHGVSIANQRDYFPLHSLIGSLIKYYEDNNVLQSDFAKCVMKMSISLFDSYNSVRNNQSYAHDNEVLEKSEAAYIVKTMSAIISFIEQIEKS